MCFHSIFAYNKANEKHDQVGVYLGTIGGNDGDVLLAVQL